jgi:PAP2 superfamily
MAMRPPHSRGRTFLPRGPVDLPGQVAIWLGFAVAYPAGRGLANRGAEPALANGESLLRFERWLHAMFELPLQRALLDVGALVTAVNWTLWLSQFVVLVFALLWIYLRRYPSYLRVRDTIIVTNAVGLAGYVLLPPRRRDFCRGRVSRTLLRRLTRSTMAAGSSSWPRTSTRRCRASTSPTR